MRKATVLLSLLATGLLASSAVSQPAQRPARLPGYLPAPAVEAMTLIAEPPAPDSELAAGERAHYQATRALAGSPRWAQAIEDAKLTEPGALRSWSCAAGIEIDAAATPVLSRLLTRVLADAGLAPNAPKEHYKRPRPFIGNQAPVCLPRASLGMNYSYPSGHASVGWAWGLVLAEAVPGKAQVLLERGRAFGDSRVVCGVHYPSDVEAGRTIGAAVVARLHADPGFLADMAVAKAEAAKAPPAKSCNGPVIAAAAAP